MARPRDAADRGLTPDTDDPATTLLTTTEAATAAHVPATVIRQWARRRLITAHPDATGTPRYYESDVLRAERDTRRAARERQLATEALDTLDHPD